MESINRREGTFLMEKQVTINTNDRRWIAISGLIFIVAWVIGLLITSSPAPTAATASVVAYYQANRGVAMLQTYLISGVTGGALLVFVAGLRSVLCRFEGGSSTLSSIIFGAGIVAAGLSFLEALFPQVLANHIAVTGDGALIRTLLELNAEIDIYKLPMLGLMIAITSLLAWRAGALPRWLVWVGVVVAVLLVLASGSTIFVGD